MRRQRIIEKIVKEKVDEYVCDRCGDTCSDTNTKYFAFGFVLLRAKKNDGYEQNAVYVTDEAYESSQRYLIGAPPVDEAEDVHLCASCKDQILPLIVSSVKKIVKNK